MDTRAEKVGYKIRQAQLRKVNYMLVIGEQEVESGLLSIRKRSGEEVKDVKIEDFISQMKEEVKEKKITE